MPPKSLLLAGIVALLAGIFLFWSIPVWRRFVEIYPWNYRELASILFWFSVSLAGAGALLLWRAAFRMLYINGQPVPREALRANLQQELSHRMVWTIYFEADYDTMYMDAIYAMDTIRGLGAKLVWITPKVRRELQQRDQPARRRVNGSRGRETKRRISHPFKKKL